MHCLDCTCAAAHRAHTAYCPETNGMVRAS